MTPDGNTGDYLTTPSTASGTANALLDWKLRVGWLGQAFDVITFGWWCRAMLRDPRPITDDPHA